MTNQENNWVTKGTLERPPEVRVSKGRIKHENFSVRMLTGFISFPDSIHKSQLPLWFPNYFTGLASYSGKLTLEPAVQVTEP